jgi:hypothetical protein
MPFESLDMGFSTRQTTSTLQNFDISRIDAAIHLQRSDFVRFWRGFEQEGNVLHRDVGIYWFEACDTGFATWQSTSKLQKFDISPIDASIDRQMLRDEGFSSHGMHGSSDVAAQKLV